MRRRSACIAAAVSVLFFLAQAPSHASTTSPAEAGAALRQLGETKYPSVYAGASVDEAAGVLQLQVTRTGSEASAMVDEAKGVPVIVKTVARSIDDHRRLMRSIIQDDAYWKGLRVRITDFGPDDLTDTVLIGIDPYSEVQAAALRGRYGAQNVKIVQSPAGVSAASRTSDSSPWNGGIYVKNSGGGVCTAGFGVNNYTYTPRYGNYLILAGHCYSNNVAVYQPNGTKVGTVYRSSSVYKDYGHDIEVIGASSSYHIWETNTATADSNDGVEYLAVGSSVCHSGAATNKKCGTVQAVDHCYLSGSLHYCNQDLVGSASLLVAAGDSGGPWFDAYTDTTGRRRFDAVGIQSLGFGQYSCTTQLGSNQKCYKQASYTEAGPAFYDYTNMWLNFDP